MSLLQPPSASEITQEVKIARQIDQLTTSPRKIADQLIQGWERSFDLLWGNQGGVTPAERIAALGTNAGELFAASSALVSFVVPLLSAADPATVTRIMSKAESMPATTTHEDGTVTLD